MPIQEGKKAPAFSLESSTGEKVALKDLADSWVVLYFYPRDNTPGCTTEANDFQENLAAFRKLDAVVLGVSKDSIQSHCKFADKFGLAFPLLSDPDGKVLEKYDAWGEKVLYGKKSMGVIRTTVLIDPDGRIAKVWSKVKVNGHADAVLETLRGLQK